MFPAGSCHGIWKKPIRLPAAANVSEEIDAVHQFHSEKPVGLSPRTEVPENFEAHSLRLSRFHIFSYWAGFCSNLVPGRSTRPGGIVFEVQVVDLEPVQRRLSFAGSEGSGHADAYDHGY